jgi:hypothetical protein
MMVNKGVILYAIDLDNGMLGLGWAESGPDWSNKQFHSSTLPIHLNDPKERFVTVVGVYATRSRPDIRIVEMRDQASLNRHDVPPLRVLGHDVEITFDSGTTSGHESYVIKPFWQIHVDGEVIGGMENKFEDIQALGSEAIKRASNYIRSRLADQQNAFAEKGTKRARPR